MAEPSQSVRQASAGRRSHHKLTGIWRVAFGGRMLAALPFDVDGSTFGLFQEARLSFALSALSRIVVCALAAVLLSPSLAVAQTPSPFRGTPSAIPGIIQAEDFDLGGQGVAYNDTTATNDGTQYRSEGPDIFSFANPDAPPEPNNFVIKNFALGEWMTYTVQVAANNRYDFQVRVASKVDTARFHIEIDGNDVTGSVAVTHTSTTTWENYQWVLVKRRVPLTAGTHVMKIVSDAEWVGLDAFNITVSNLGTPYGGTPAAIPGRRVSRDRHGQRRRPVPAE
jgi:hypothetical protein